jgi:hypothetical protein
MDGGIFRNGACRAAAPLVVRPSSMAAYPDCPRRWAARRLAGDIEALGYQLRSLDIGIAAVVGSAVHAGAATTLAEKVQTGALAPVTVATDAAMQTLHNGVADGCMWDRTTANRADAELQTRRMVGIYRQVLAPQIDPVSVEARLEAMFSPAIVVSGQHDVLAREPHALCDLKTGRQPAHCKPQLGAYSLLARTYDHPVTALHEHWVPRTPISKPQPRPAIFKHDMQAAEAAGVAVLRAIERDVNVFRDGDAEHNIPPGEPWAFIANPSSTLCSATYCPAHGTEFCREWRARG